MSIFKSRTRVPGDISIHLSFSCSLAFGVGDSLGVNCQQCDTRVVPNNKIKLLVGVAAYEPRGTGKHYIPKKLCSQKEK